MPNVSKVNQNECTGCEACENICPQKCIRLGGKAKFYENRPIDAGIRSKHQELITTNWELKTKN